MELKYDISNYITKVKMSSKKRILVEGRDDKSHIGNLLSVVLDNHKVKIDTAESIKGDCAKTAKNNRAKIEKIHESTKGVSAYSNLFYFCDREFDKFNISEKITDSMQKHEREGNFNWTLGHSMENYFIYEDIVCQAYRFLCCSEYKNQVEQIFRAVFPAALRMIAAVSLTAKKIQKCTYPSGTIMWKHFLIDDDSVNIDIDAWASDQRNLIADTFMQEFKVYILIANGSDTVTCSRVCRGHTAMIMLQRVFSACLFSVISVDNKTLAEKAASEFSGIKETTLISALSEAWIQNVKKGEAIYPENLIEAIA